jgi:alkylated DNA nucleotide flippase Atl1
MAAARLSIEHIMPQTLSEEWRALLQEQGENPDVVRDELVHTLGNLTLTGYNGELSNNPFERKRQIYGASNLRMNRALVESETWGRTQILARSNELAGRIVEIWPAPVPGSRGAVLGFDWSRVDAAVIAIPEGSWTTYGDLALLGGTSPQSVGNRMASAAAPVGAHRVLDAQGRINSGFRWPDAGDTPDLTTVLEAEGLGFGEDGMADRDRRLNVLQLARLISYEFEQDELDRLSRLYSEPQGRDGTGPWLSDGRSWHLQQAPACGEIMLMLERLITEALPDAPVASWAQKYYIAWRTPEGRIWLALHHRQHWVWLEFNQPAFTGEEAADALSFALVPAGATPDMKQSGRPQVQAGNGKVWIQVKASGDVDGPTGVVLSRLLTQTWVKIAG